MAVGRAILFSLDDVCVARSGRNVLAGVSLCIEEGFTAVVGPSGAGKSTLLRLLNRLADPDRGAIRFAGRPLVEYDVLELRRTVALVAQLPALLPGSVEDNETLCRNLDVTPEWIIEKTGIEQRYIADAGDSASDSAVDFAVSPAVLSVM